MNKKVLDKEGTAYLVEKIKENFVAKKDLEPVNELPEVGEPGRIYIIPEKKYINLEMVYANDYQQLIVVHDGYINPEHQVESSYYDIGISNDAVKITVAGLEFSGEQGLAYEDDYEDQHGRIVHGWVYHCQTMETPEFEQIVIENGGTLAGLPVTAEIVEGLFIDDEGGVTPKFTASFNYGEDINNTTVITNNYTQYIYTEENGWEEIGGNNTQYEDMPEPSSDNVGQIIQYTGEDNEELEQGYFYICKEEEVSGIVNYYWEEINVQDAPDMSDYYTKTQTDALIQPMYVYRISGADFLSNSFSFTITDAGVLDFMNKTKDNKSALLILHGDTSSTSTAYMVIPSTNTNTYGIVIPTINGTSQIMRREVRCEKTLTDGVITKVVIRNGNYQGWGKKWIPYTADVLTRNNTDSYTPTSDYHPATKKYVDDLASAAIKRVVVQQLPTEDIKTDTIYMVPAENPGTENVYDEFMYINDAWEQIGSTSVDLSDYVTNTEMEEYVEEHTAQQAETMPEASADNAGSIIQYTGDDESGLEQGHFYICVEEEVSGVSTYHWEEINVQDSTPVCYLSSTMLQLEVTDTSAQIIEKLGGADKAQELLDAVEHEYPIMGLDIDEHTLGGLFGNLPVTVVSYHNGTGRVMALECTTQGTLEAPYFVHIVLYHDDATDTWACMVADISGLSTKVHTMPTADINNAGMIIQYVGNTTNEYTNGYFYQCVPDGSNPPVYSWQELKTQDSPSSDETVRQAKGWHLHQDISNIHAFYEDAQWIIDQWIALGSEGYRVPNFSVDGYTLNRMGLNSSSSTYDYRDWSCTFGKVYNATYYYYNVYFSTHYNSYLIYDETSNRKASRNGYYTLSYLTSHQSLSNYLSKTNTTSYTPTSDYHPSTKKYVDDTAAAAVEQAIEEASIQLDELPEPSSTNVGEVYQYTGPDTQDLDHGHFYEIVEVEVSGVTTYEYQDIGITVGVTTAVAPQEITDITYGAYRRYPGYSETGLQLLQNNNGQLIWGQTVNSIWIGTQQEYDDLPEHFDTMIYFIKEDE